MIFGKTLFFLSLILVVSCSQPQNTTNNKTQENKFGFPLTNPSLLTSRSHSGVALDSLSRAMWTDRIMGRDQFYHSAGLACFDQMNGFDLVAVETSADDWSKTFLLTLNTNRGLVDFIEITDDWGDASQDENGSETVLGTNMRTDFSSKSRFIRTTINETIYNYQASNELTEADSIVETFTVDKQGKFVRLKRDSTRIRK